MHGTTVKIIEYEQFITEGADRPALYDSRSESYSDKADKTRRHQIQRKICHFAAWNSENFISRIYVFFPSSLISCEITLEG